MTTTEQVSSAAVTVPGRGRVDGSVVPNPDPGNGLTVRGADLAPYRVA